MMCQTEDEPEYCCGLLQSISHTFPEHRIAQRYHDTNPFLVALGTERQHTSVHQAL